MKWNGYKGLWVIEGRAGYIPCILQIQLNEGRETKAVFQGSFWLRRPSVTFDDVAAEICRLLGYVAFRLRSTLVVFILTWTLGPNKGNTSHKLSSGQVQKTQAEPILPIHRIRKLRRAPKTPRGPIALKDGFILVLFWIWPTAMKTWMIIYCNAVLSSAFQCKHLSNVTSMW